MFNYLEEQNLKWYACDRRLRSQLQRARQMSSRGRMSMWTTILRQGLLCKVFILIIIIIVTHHQCHHNSWGMPNWPTILWQGLLRQFFLSISLNTNIFSVCPVLCSGHGEYGGGRSVPLFHKCFLYRNIKQISPTLGCLTFSMIRSFKDTCVATSTLACLVFL